MTDIGRAAAGNPTKDSRVYASGFRETDGLCVDPDSNTAFQTEALRGATPDDPINVLTSGGVYSWPVGAPADQSPLAALPQTSRAPGGCAVLGGGPLRHLARRQGACSPPTSRPAATAR